MISERRERGDLDAYVMPESYDDATEKRLAVVRQKWKESAVGSGPASFVSDQAVLESQLGLDAPRPQIIREKQKLAGKDRQYTLMDDAGAEIEFVPGDVLSETLPFDVEGDDASASYNLTREEREQMALVSALQLFSSTSYVVFF